MPWVKLDDQFFSHPKVIDRSKDAKLLYMASLTYCAANLTDGYLSPAALRLAAAMVDVPAGVAQELVSAGLWTRCENGYQIHDYLEYNPSAEEVKQQRADNARRQAEWRDRNKTSGVTNEGRNVDSNGVTNTVRASGSNDHPVPTPVPVPTPAPKPPPEGNEKKAPGKPSRVRKPDQLYESVALACYEKPYTELTDSERKLVGSATAELRKVGATPADVFERAARYRARSPGYSLPPKTLVRVWTEMGKPQLVVSNGKRSSGWDATGMAEVARQLRATESGGAR